MANFPYDSGQLAHLLPKTKVVSSQAFYTTSPTPCATSFPRDAQRLGHLTATLGRFATR